MLFILGIAVFVFGAFVSIKIKNKIPVLLALVLGGLIALAGFAEEARIPVLTNMQGQAEAVTTGKITLPESEAIANLAGANESNAQAELNLAIATKTVGELEIAKSNTEYVQRSVTGAAAGLAIANLGLAPILGLLCCGGGIFLLLAIVIGVTRLARGVRG